MTGQAELAFSGATYDPELDRERLSAQARKVWDVMVEASAWWTLAELQDATGIRSEASISARLRDLRKEAFGGHTVERRRWGWTDEERAAGVFEYRLIPRGCVCHQTVHGRACPFHPNVRELLAHDEDQYRRATRGDSPDA